MKKRLVSLCVVLALVSFSALALAAPAKQEASKAGQGGVPEKRAAVQAIVDSHKERLFELHEKLWAKKTELNALVEMGKAERSDIQSLIAEMLELRAARHQERQAMRAEIEKTVGHRLRQHFWKRFHGGERYGKSAEYSSRD
jgi:zinc resistance-associated protein